MDDEQLLKLYDAHIAQGASEEDAMRAVDAAAAGTPQSPPPAPEVPSYDRPGKVEGVARGLLKGMTLNLGDDAMAGYAGIGAMWPGGRSPAQAVRETLGSEHQREDQFTKDNPKTQFASEMIGGAAPLVLGPGKAAVEGLNAGARVLPTVLKGMGSGAALGEVAGAGASRAEGVKDRLAERCGRWGDRRCGAARARGGQRDDRKPCGGPDEQAGGDDA